jgi:hypothetical protein
MDAYKAKLEREVQKALEQAYRDHEEAMEALTRERDALRYERDSYQSRHPPSAPFEAAGHDSLFQRPFQPNPVPVPTSTMAPPVHYSQGSDNPIPLSAPPQYRGRSINPAATSFKPEPFNLKGILTWQTSMTPPVAPYYGYS